MLNHVRPSPGWLARKLDDVRETFVCLGLALRDAAHPKLAFLSLGTGLLASLFWLAVLVIWWQPIWLGAQVVATAIAAGIVFTLMPAAPAVGGSVAAMGNIASAYAPWLLAIQFGPIFTVFVLVGGYLLLVMLSVRILLELMLMTRIQTRVLRRYPGVERGADASFRAGLRDWLGTTSTFVFGGLLCLIVPVLGGALFFVLASYLNVRSLINDALEDVASDAERRQVIKANRLRMALLGVLMSALMLVPVVGFFMPVLLGAAVVHLSVRAHLRLKAGEAG